jgi:hypothetical protein
MGFARPPTRSRGCGFNTPPEKEKRKRNARSLARTPNNSNEQAKKSHMGFARPPTRSRGCGINTPPEKEKRKRNARSLARVPTQQQQATTRQIWRSSSAFATSFSSSMRLAALRYQPLFRVRLVCRGLGVASGTTAGAGCGCVGNSRVAPQATADAVANSRAAASAKSASSLHLALAFFILWRRWPASCSWRISDAPSTLKRRWSARPSRSKI